MCFSSKSSSRNGRTLSEYCGNRGLGPRACTPRGAPVFRCLQFPAVVSEAPRFQTRRRGRGGSPRRPPPPQGPASPQATPGCTPGLLAPSGQQGPRPLALRTRTEAARVHTPPGRGYSPRRRQRSTPASRDSGWDILPPAAPGSEPHSPPQRAEPLGRKRSPGQYRGFSAPRPNHGLNLCLPRPELECARERHVTSAAAPALTSPPAAGCGPAPTGELAGQFCGLRVLGSYTWAHQGQVS